ncbi:hypothetical protein NDU88_005516 [Pleurodeles waltl]|uniref:Uncharacterized protein n=1 Tax=Pleurodeles waltl TaxID=8319 RepID=A0AAV7TWT9_PLEWA|nr:hypothetical protein NDU88_005516 [Pleurodeles waltl]
MDPAISDKKDISTNVKVDASRPTAAQDKDLAQSEKKKSLSDHSSWSSNERSDSEVEKISLEPDSEISSLASDKELPESGKITTVRKKQRKRSEHLGSTKHLSTPQDTKGLQWDYSNTQFKGDLTVYGNTEKQCNLVSLETIYQGIMEHREESKIKSCRTQLACHKMQTQIRCVAKTCSAFATRMEEVETRISRLEDDVGSQKLTRDTMEKQLEDTQWKLTDLEDRLRRNNLRVLGIQKGLRGLTCMGLWLLCLKRLFRI